MKSHENIIARLKELHAEWDKQANKRYGSYYSNNDEGKIQSEIFDHCAEELAEVIKELDGKENP